MSHMSKNWDKQLHDKEAQIALSQRFGKRSSNLTASFYMELADFFWVLEL